MRRAFFERYAIFYNFDALVAENWYSQTHDRILTFKVILLLLISMLIVMYRVAKGLLATTTIVYSKLSLISSQT